MILELAEQEDNYDNSLIDAIEILLIKKEEIVEEIIIQNTTKLS